MENPDTFRGISIGSTEDPLNPAQQAFAERGIPVSKATIHHLRYGTTTGAYTGTKVECADIFERNDASRKDGFFLGLAQTGLALRTPQKSNTQRYNSQGFTDSIAESLQIKQDAVLAYLRSFRAQAVLSEAEGHDPGFTNLFVESARHFLNVMTVPSNSATSKPLLELAEDWDYRTVTDFYHKLVTLSGSSTATWPSHEVEVIEAFSHRQAQRNNPLTPLDTEILSQTLESVPEHQIAAHIEQRTGLPYSRILVTLHRNVLVYGTRLNPYIRG